MHLYRSSLGVVVQAPAKLNLFFEVLGERPDGYHEIETLVLPIDWCDTLYFATQDEEAVSFISRRPQGFRHVPGLGLNVPEGPENLATQAVELVRTRAGVTSGATVRLIKRIPSAAGLGGGSSDAAAALAAANALWGLGWNQKTLAKLGAELGSDVPLFFARGAAICRGRGEQVEPLEGGETVHFVVSRPPAGLATAAVYKACQPGRSPRSVQPLREALQRGNLGDIGRLLFNRLESAAETLSPWIGRLRNEMAGLDLLGHQMSGSGTCYFGLCRSARHARRVAERLCSRGVGIAVAVRGSR